MISIMYVFFLSCGKETNINEASTEIAGDYNFVGIDGYTKSSSTVMKPLDTTRVISTTYYSTFNNAGTVKFTSNKIINTNLYYSVSSSFHELSYVGSTLINEQDSPYTGYSGPTGGEESYIRNNNDSLTFATSVFDAHNPFIPNNTPMGAQISWKADTLLLKITQESSSITLQPGYPKTEYSNFIQAIIKLKKK